MTPLRYKRVRPGTPELKLQSEGAAGYDISVALDVPAGDEDAIAHLLVPSGISIEIPKGHVGHILPRGGTAPKGYLVVHGVIDSDFRGEMFVSLIQLFGAQALKAGQRVAQLVVAPCVQVDTLEVEELPPTLRGSGMLGSTGA